ncbi:MAG: S8 family peptidase [Betaproteobacteria bacterium]
MVRSLARPPQATRPALAALAFALATSIAAPAFAGTVAGLRVMLHPAAAPRGTLSDAMHAKLERIAGTTLALSATTRTGALELTTPAPIDEALAARIAKSLREDRSVLWAEPVRPARAVTKTAARDPRYNRLGRHLMVRLADSVSEDWSALAPRFAERVGMPLIAERKVGNVWLVAVAVARTPDGLAELAEALQQDAAVMYADPVRRMYPQFVPNDPLFPIQWSLSDPVSGVNATAAWDIQQGSAGLAVAVIDTGIVDHPDLAGRLLPGYDFVTDAARARDGDGRDPNPRDEGDWAGAGDCGEGVPGFDSFFHGLFVAGLIGANPNNGIGIAGVDWAAKILPVRALAQCGGTEADVFEAMLWASGVQIQGVPPNPNPARVINMSLAGSGSCSAAVQEAIDDALAQGSVVIVAAGNDSLDAVDFVPGSCSGVVTVGASNSLGDRTGYSNYGRRVDLSAPGGDGGDETSLIVSTYAEGATTPGAPTYAIAAGTSFATPLVTGAVSLMLARNATLTAGRVLSILQGTTREFPLGAQCRAGPVCGAGLLDAGLAVASTLAATATIPPNAVPVIEYYRADIDHYFITADPNEVAYLDVFLRAVWQRTGSVFFGYQDSFLAPPGVKPVCRFVAGGIIDSHFFTASAAECQFVQARWAGVWALESPAAFWIEVPDASGACREGTIPIHRFFDNRQDANHRHTPDLSVKRAMINRGWVPEGNNGVAFCSPI